MRVFLISLALLAFAGVAPAAIVHETPPGVEITEDTWQGVLVDWDCKQKSVEPACPVGPGTERFALSIDGGILLHFDDHGNELTLEALREARAGGSVEAIVVGKREGRLLKVESVRIGAVEIS